MSWQAKYWGWVAYLVLCLFVALSGFIPHLPASVQLALVLALLPAGMLLWWWNARWTRTPEQPMCLLREDSLAVPRMCCASGPHYHLYLQLRYGQLRVARHHSTTAHTAAAPPTTPPPFPLRELEAVFCSPAPWNSAVREWSLASCADNADLLHPAAPAYRALQGPLHIEGRRWWLLEVHVDALALARSSGTVQEALSQLATHIGAHLALHKMQSRLVDDTFADAFADRWKAAPEHQRTVVAGDTPTAVDAPPASGDGPIIGADEADRAVCVDLAGAHLRHVVFVGAAEEIHGVMMRQAALGWSAAVVTDRAEQWYGLAASLGWALFAPGSVEAFLRAASPTDKSWDVLVWDCGMPPPKKLVHHVRSHSTSRVGTVWEVLPPQELAREQALQRARQMFPDIVVDARVAGWIALEMRTRLPADTVDEIAVQTVTVPEEEQFLRDAAARPRPGDVLRV